MLSIFSGFFTFLLIIPIMIILGILLLFVFFFILVFLIPTQYIVLMNYLRNKSRKKDKVTIIEHDNFEHQIKNSLFFDFLKMVSLIIINRKLIFYFIVFCVIVSLFYLFG